MDAFSGPGGGVGGDGGLYEFGSCYLCSAGADPRETCRLEDHLGPGTRVRETEQQQDPSRRPLLGLTGWPSHRMRDKNEGKGFLPLKDRWVDRIKQLYIKSLILDCPIFSFTIHWSQSNLHMKRICICEFGISFTEELEKPSQTVFLQLFYHLVRSCIVYFLLSLWWHIIIDKLNVFKDTNMGKKIYI